MGAAGGEEGQRCSKGEQGGGQDTSPLRGDIFNDCSGFVKVKGFNSQGSEGQGFITLVGG